MGTKVKTDFLFASPSITSGAARLFDWFGQFDEYNASADGAEADAKAAFADWAVVGNDIKDALDDFASSHSA